MLAWIAPTLDNRTSSARRKHLQEIFRQEIGVSELSGKNDGKRIGSYLHYTGTPPGYAWCAAFVSWCFGKAGYREPCSAWSPTLFPKKHLIWQRNGPVVRIPQTADVFGIYYNNLRRIGHVGFVDQWDSNWCITVEGNTGSDGALPSEPDKATFIRAGPEGVYRKRRPISTIYMVADWLNK